MSKKDLNPLFKILDILTILFAWASSFYIRFYINPFNLTNDLGLSVKMYVIFGVLTSLFWYMCLELFGAYKTKSDSIFHSYSFEIWPIIRASLIAFSMSVVGLHFLARDFMSRGVLVLFILTVMLFLILQKTLVKHLFIKFIKPKERNLLIIGNKAQALKIKDELPSYFKISILESELVDKLDEYIKKTNARDVLVCLDNPLSLDKVLEITSRENVYTHIIPTLSHITLLGLEAGSLGGYPLLSVNQHSLQGFNAFVKRVFDLSISSFALVLLSPIFLIFSILIKLSSKGSVFYTQERIGLNGEIFKIYKFRSMKQNAEKDIGPVFTKENDSRVFFVGKLMRKTSLDELPQFINVLKGEMSIVGPRPERPIFVNKFKHGLPGYMQRHKIKAGITGWAQVNGFRGNTSIKERMKYDLYYINNWSIMFDIKIMILTAFSLISKNAY